MRLKVRTEGAASAFTLRSPTVRPPTKLCRHDGLEIVVSKGGDGAVVRSQSAHEAQRFGIAGADLLEMARRSDLIEVHHT